MTALLTVPEVREHVTTTLGDDALERVIDACQADIDRWAGSFQYPADEAQEVVETVYAQGRTLLRLSMEPLEVAEVVDIVGSTETALLVDDDWRIRGDSLERVGYLWGERTRVTYTPANSLTIRQRALWKLVQLEINHDPLVGSQRVGEWSRSSMVGTDSYREEKAAILWDVREPDWFA